MDCIDITHVRLAYLSVSMVIGWILKCVEYFALGAINQYHRHSRKHSRKQSQTQTQTQAQTQIKKLKNWKKKNLNV